MNFIIWIIFIFCYESHKSVTFLYSQPAFTCSKSIMKIPKQSEKSIQVNNKPTRMTSLTLFLFLLLTLNKILTLFWCFIADFEQVNSGCVVINQNKYRINKQKGDVIKRMHFFFKNVNL